MISLLELRSIFDTTYTFSVVQTVVTISLYSIVFCVFHSMVQPAEDGCSPCESRSLQKEMKIAPPKSVKYLPHVPEKLSLFHQIGY